MFSIFRKWSIELRRKRLRSERDTQQSYRVIEEDKKGAGQSCMNCKVPLTGPFCHICGQKDDDLRRPIWTFFRELLDNVFSADSRLIKSIFLILLVPGGLTRAYSMGRRARFVPPLRLYLSVSIMFFAILWLFDILILDIKLTAKDAPPETPVVSENSEGNTPDTPPPPTVQDDGKNRSAIDDLVTGFNNYEPKSEEGEKSKTVPAKTEPEAASTKPEDEESQTMVGEFLQGFKEGVKGQSRRDQKFDETLNDIERQIADLPVEMSDEDKAKVREALLGAKDQIEEAEERVRVAQGESDLDIFGDKFPYYVSVRMFVHKPDEEYEGIKQEDLDKFLSSDDNSDTAKEVVRGLARALKEPRRFNDLFNEWLPKTLFVMVPLFALILRFFHWGKKRVYIHQLVFSLHFHSFLFLLFSALIVVVPVFGGESGFMLFWWGASLYLIISLKVGQNQGWLRAFFKAGFIWVSYTLLMMVGLSAAIFEGLKDL
ncbi:DUF3667 domain-containing protein [Kordiimonas laminariae]|uniref:DUF3667 domain-containing protein n=1 Tax=Kordiimonas laminariae TaxID=2917717 RepID=UPI001FF398D1|nr:DUF3667 domain-containing protein [Kordiimonas laminariae]MCK0068581.1 DUF3667 domain-containing protein [Kordiimonas laminariae]